MALGQHLERVLSARAITSNTSRDELVRDVLVEQVAHRVHEDHPRPAPAQRLLEPLGPQPQVEALLVGVARHAAPALGERLGVAVRAAGRDLRAARHRVPGRLGPLDRAPVSHIATVLRHVLGTPSSPSSPRHRGGLVSRGAGADDDLASRRVADLDARGARLPASARPGDQRERCDARRSRARALVCACYATCAHECDVRGCARCAMMCMGTRFRTDSSRSSDVDSRSALRRRGCGSGSGRDGRSPGPR